MAISEKEISSFEENLYRLKNSISDFDNKVSECRLYGVIDITHKIETDIEKLDTELTRIVKSETSSIDQIRDIRLEDNLNDLKDKYKNTKTTFEQDCICMKR